MPDENRLSVTRLRNHGNFAVLRHNDEALSASGACSFLAFGRKNQTGKKNGYGADTNEKYFGFHIHLIDTADVVFCMNILVPVSWMVCKILISLQRFAGGFVNFP